MVGEGWAENSMFIIKNKFKCICALDAPPENIQWIEKKKNNILILINDKFIAAPCSILVSGDSQINCGSVIY